MAEPSMSELAALIHTLTTKVDNIQAEVANVKKMVAGIQTKVDGLQPGASSSGPSGATPGSGEHYSDRPPRFQKMDFLKFDGKSDPLAFINRCESFFHQQRIIVEEQVWMASYNLQDVAQLWYIQVQCEEGTPSWRRFVELLNLRFDPPLRSNPLGDLAACKRTGSVVEYQECFEALLPRAGYLSERQKVQLFTAGLQPPLSLDVEIHNPQALSVAMSLARKLELRDQCAASGQAPARLSQCGILPAPQVLAQPAPSQASTSLVSSLQPPPTSMEGRSIKRLSPAEMDEWRWLGLCFNCNEKFGHGHNRVCQRLFLITFADKDDVDTESPMEPLADEPTISVLAISGVRTRETMQMGISIDGSSFCTLLDSGSTHNFITEEVAARTDLVLRPQGGMRVIVANGDSVQSHASFATLRSSSRAIISWLISTPCRLPATTSSLPRAVWRLWGPFSGTLAPSAWRSGTTTIASAGRAWPSRRPLCGSQ
jgi:hypothetical protein